MIESTWFIELAIRGGVILLLAGLVAVCLRGAAWRHLVWASALVGLIFLPLLMGGVPSIALRILPPAETVVSESASVPARNEAAEPTVRPTSSRAEEVRLADLRTAGGSTAPAPQPESTLARLSLFDLWWIVAAVLGAGMAADRIRRRRLLRRARPLAATEWHSDLERSSRLGRSVRLLVSPDVDVPVTWGLMRPVLLLPSGAESWTGSLRRHVLLHELAHVERCDAAILGLARFACALHWFNPLAWWALRRLVREAELAADDQVLLAGAAPSSYAGDLVAFARRLRRPLPRAAAAMARRRSPLTARVVAILDQSRVRSTPRRARVALALTLVGLVVLPVAAALRPARREAPLAVGFSIGELGIEIRPGVQATSTPAPKSRNQAAPAPRSVPEVQTQAMAAPVSSPSPSPDSAVMDDCGDSRGASIHSEDDHSVIKVRSERCELRIESDGEIEYADDDSGVVRLGRNARLEIDERRNGARRRLTVTPGPGGAPDYRRTVDGDERAFDADGRSWLAQVMPEIFRATGLNADKRVARILREQGVAGVLAEIELIRSDFVGRRYLVLLLGQAQLDPGELRAWIELAGRSVGSDYELAEALTALPASRLGEPGVGEAFVEAASTIGSDYELRRTLAALLGGATPTRATLDRILAGASTIGSDYELAELLIQVANAYPTGEPLPMSYYQAADTIGSDYELRRTLAQALKRPLGDGALVDLLRSAHSIGSDYELATLLVQVGRTQRLEGAAREAFVAALETVGSDYEHDRAAAVLARQSR